MPAWIRYAIAAALIAAIIPAIVSAARRLEHRRWIRDLDRAERAG